MNVRHFFSETDKKRIVDAIRTAESDTSGEIRVHLSEHCRSGALNCAAYWFAKLKMHQTSLRNGVLSFLAIKDRQFAIIGDAGIHSRVPDDFWDNIKTLTSEKFSKGCFTEGLEEGILLTGKQLKTYFPKQENDKNELLDDISFS